MKRGSQLHYSRLVASTAESTSSGLFRLREQSNPNRDFWRLVFPEYRGQKIVLVQGIGYLLPSPGTMSLSLARRTGEVTAMANLIQKIFGKGRNTQGEVLARFPKDEINAWHQRLLDVQVEHLQPGDILLKMNFTMDATPVANVISTGQRMLQSYEKEGSYATGHVAVALDPLRLAEQTGAGVSINTLGVTDKNVAEHKIDLVYYYVFRCMCRKVSDAAAKLAESFTTGSPLANRSGPLQAGIGGGYDLGTAVQSVFKKRSAAIANPIGESGDIKLDDWSQNVLDYCTGKTHVRKDMFCSAFVLAVYQAACKYVIEEEERTRTQREKLLGGGQLRNRLADKQYRSCLMDLVAFNTTPRTYEVCLRTSSSYVEQGVFRYVDQDELHRTKEAASRIFANLSQAIDNYANFVTTGVFKAAGDKTLKESVESLVSQKVKALKPKPAKPGRFERFFGAQSRAGKTGSEVLFGSPTDLRKQAIQQTVTQDDNGNYQNLKRSRDRILAEQYADPEFFSNAVMAFREECEFVSRGERGSPRGILSLFLLSSLEVANNVHDKRNRIANRRGGSLGDIDFDAVMAGNI